MEIMFTLNGNRVALSSDQVEAAVEGVNPEPLRSHAVEIQGSLYPIKQPFALALNLDRLDFNTNQARTQLKRLGFHVSRVGNYPSSSSK